MQSYFLVTEKLSGQIVKVWQGFAAVYNNGFAAKTGKYCHLSHITHNTENSRETKLSGHIILETLTKG